MSTLAMSYVADKRRLCRLCGLSKDVILIPIFAKENATLVKEIEFLIKRKPSINDALPPFICHRCNFRITAFKDFRNMCLETLHHLQDKNIDSNEDNEVIIIDERAGDIAQHERNTEKEYSELQDAQHLPQPSSASQQFLLEGSNDAHTYTMDQPFHNRFCRKHNLTTSIGHQSTAPFHKKRQSPDQYRDQRELVYQQKQALSLQYKRECITKTRKLQNGFVSGPTLPEIRPEIVNEQLGTVGYLLSETFSSQSHQVTQGIQSLDSTQQHDKSTDERRTQRLEAGKRSGFRVSFSDCESIRLKEKEPIYCAVCSRVFQSNVILREHVKFVHGFVQSERKKDKPSFSHQPVSQSHMCQQLLDRGYLKSFSCKLCNRKFTNILILKRHMRDNHSDNAL